MKTFFVSAGTLTRTVLLLAFVSCKGGDATAPLVATTLVANSSTSLTGIAGAVVTPAPSVIAKDQNGAPMSGAIVTFSVTGGGGSVSDERVTTDAAGVATVGSWTLGPSTGANTLSASSGAVAAVNFTATSTAGAAASLAKNAGDNQTAAAGNAVPVAPSVIVKDANGNPRADVSVTFSVASGGGSVTGPTAVTNASGIATVGSWTLGTSTGINTLSAASAGLTTVTFTATSSTGAAASFAKNAGDNQTAQVGSAVAVPPSVVVKDANGNPKADVSVTFSVASGGGSVTGATAVTNASGIATVGSWTLGPLVGANTLSATSAGLTAVAFTATSTAGPAATLAKNAGDNQSAPAGSAVSVPPSVVVKDANGNAKPGVTVTFSVVSGGGSITGASSVTNASGIAAVGSWILGTSIGTNLLSATAPGLSSVNFTATAVVNLCTARLSHSFGSTSSGTLASDDCKLPDGSFADFYSTSVPQAGAYLFRESAGFDTYLLLTRPDGTTVAENDDENPDTGTNSGIKALLPAGDFLIGATSFNPGVTGDYSISSAGTSTDVANCEDVFVVKDISTTQNITAADCNLATPGATPIYADGYFVFLSAGTTVTIDMTSTALDSFLELRAGTAVVAQNDNRDASTKDARITYTAPQSNYYIIFARSVPTASVGAYTLTIQ